MKIVRIDAEADDITYGTVEPDGIRLYHGSPLFQWERSETVLPITEVKPAGPGDSDEGRGRRQATTSTMPPRCRLGRPGVTDHLPQAADVR